MTLPLDRVGHLAAFRDGAVQRLWLAQVVLAAVLAFWLWLGATQWAESLAPRQTSLLTGREVSPAIPSFDPPLLDDLVVFYAGAELVRTGNGDLLYDLESIRESEQQIVGRDTPFVLPFFNPPAFAALLVPLSFLPFGAAAAVFLAASVAAGGVALALLWRIASLKPLTGMLWLTAFLASLAAHDTLLHGQISSFLMLVWVVVFLAVRAGRNRAAGAVLALLLVKPQLALFPIALLVWKRRWRSLQGFAVVALLGAVVSVLVAGPGVIASYPRFLLAAAGVDEANGVSIWGMFGWNAFVRGITGPDRQGLVTALALVLSLATGAVCLRAWAGKWDAASPRFPAQFAALVVAALLASPHLYRQDLVILAVPAALLLIPNRESSLSLPRAAYFMAGWSILFFHFRILPLTGLNLITLLMASALVMAAVDAGVFGREGWKSMIASFGPGKAGLLSCWLGGQRVSVFDGLGIARLDD